MVENMIDQASSCVPIVIYLDKMPNALQTFPYVFLHISKPKQMFKHIKTKPWLQVMWLQAYGHGTPFFPQSNSSHTLALFSAYSHNISVSICILSLAQLTLRPFVKILKCKAQEKKLKNICKPPYLVDSFFCKRRGIQILLSSTCSNEHFI